MIRFHYDIEVQGFFVGQDSNVLYIGPREADNPLVTMVMGKISNGAVFVPVPYDIVEEVEEPFWPDFVGRHGPLWLMDSRDITQETLDILENPSLDGVRMPGWYESDNDEWFNVLVGVQKSIILWIGMKQYYKDLCLYGEASDCLPHKIWLKPLI